MRKITISLIVFFLIAGMAAKVYAEDVKIGKSSDISREDVISYCGSAIDVSSEVLKNFFDRDYQLLGKFSKTLGAIDILDKLINADNKGAALAAANMASMEFISHVSSAGGGLITAYTAYCKALVLVRDYAFIPALEDGAYATYKKLRFPEALGEEVAPEDVFVNKALEPIVADIKKRLIKEKYADKNVTNWLGILKPEWKKPIDEEARIVCMERLEARYQAEKTVKTVLASEGDIRKAGDKMIGELKEKLTMTVKGSVFDKETKRPIAGAKVKLQGYNIGKITNSAGAFTLEVPYRDVGSKPFKIAVKKEGYKPALSNKSYSFKDTEIKSLTAYLNPSEEKGDCMEIYWKAMREISNQQNTEHNIIEHRCEDEINACEEVKPGLPDPGCRRAAQNKLFEASEPISKAGDRRKKIAEGTLMDCLAAKDIKYEKQKLESKMEEWQYKNTEGEVRRYRHKRPTRRFQYGDGR